MIVCLGAYVYSVPIILSILLPRVGIIELRDNKSIVMIIRTKIYSNVNTLIICNNIIYF